MSTPSFDQVSLAAGEEAVFMGEGYIALALKSGNAESAGVTLQPGKTYRFLLYPGQRMSIYSLDGAEFFYSKVSANSVEVKKGATEMAEIFGTARSLVDRGSPQTRVLVLSKYPGLGHSEIAKALCNLCLRFSGAGGVAAGAEDQVSFVYAGADASTVGCDKVGGGGPGSIGCVEVRPPSISPDAGFADINGNGFQFFTGTAINVTPTDGALALHWLRQCTSCANWLMNREQKNRRWLFVEAPLPPLSSISSSNTSSNSSQQNNNSTSSSSSSAGGGGSDGSSSDDDAATTFLKQCVDIVGPTVIVAVGSSAKEYAALKASVQRTNSGAVFATVPPISQRIDKPSLLMSSLDQQQQQQQQQQQINGNNNGNGVNPTNQQQLMSLLAKSNSSSNKRGAAGGASQGLGGDRGLVTDPDALAVGLAEVFVGSPAMPLACSKVVCPLSAVTFVTVGLVHGVPQATVYPPPYTDLCERICAVSHAVQLEEVTCANTAGLVLVDHVNKADNEVVLTVPSGDLFLPGPFLIVGSPSLTLKDSLLARARI